MGYVAAIVISAMAIGGLFLLKTVLIAAVILLVKLAIFMFACVIGLLAFTRSDS
jgi:hypothetical protein